MRVLLLAPFSPLEEHDHAAADTLNQLVPKIAEHVELHVFTPEPVPEGELVLAGLTYGLHGPKCKRSSARGVLSKVGLRPSWLRSTWPAYLNEEVRELIKLISPDLVHAEYLQTSEAVYFFPRVVLGLHDYTTNVMWRSMKSSRGLSRIYRAAEYLRTSYFEKSVVAKAAAVVALSEPAADAVRIYNSNVRVAHVGMEVRQKCWKPKERDVRPVLIFAGAMWRQANVATAQFLVREVMPLVWACKPATELRIVGAKPVLEIRELESADARIRVLGRVVDLDESLVDGSAVLAPTVFGGGILMKVLRGMALGCPVVTTADVASSVGADSSMLLIGETSGDLARRAVMAIEDPLFASEVGRRARAHVQDTFGWETAVSVYLAAYRSTVP